MGLLIILWLLKLRNILLLVMKKIEIVINLLHAIFTGK